MVHTSKATAQHRIGGGGWAYSYATRLLQKTGYTCTFISVTKLRQAQSKSGQIRTHGYKYYKEHLFHV